MKIKFGFKTLCFFILILFVIISLLYFLLFFEPIEEENNEILNQNYVNTFSKDIIEENIELGKKYLMKVINKKEGGAYKHYYTKNDTYEERLYTTYTATTLFTLIKYYDFIYEDKGILEIIPKVVDFIFSMQNLDNDSKAYGAFDYSYLLDDKSKDNRYVVGTNSKTIFTLLKLYNMTSEEKYLDSAKLASDWLLTMQKENGEMKSYIRLDNNSKWYHSTKYSILYNGEVLSALSRTYQYTKDKKYYNAAERIAENFEEHIEEKGCYLGDDYRDPNLISSSWVVMSLLDFYKASKNEKYKEIVFKCSNETLNRQNLNLEDLTNYGRWNGTAYSSGNAWISEVLTEVYTFCRKNNMVHCNLYKKPIVKNFYWLNLLTYSEEKPFSAKNISNAVGGLIRNYNFGLMEIRTDSVAHALNAYINIYDELREEDFDINI